MALLDRHHPKGASQTLPKGAPQVLALPEVDHDLQELATDADGDSLMQELRHRVAVLCTPNKTPNAKSLDPAPTDLSDLTKQKLGVPQRKEKDPLRWIYQRLDDGRYLVVTVRPRFDPKQHVYAEASARLGRGFGFTLLTGTDVDVHCQLTDAQRRELWLQLGIHAEPGDLENGHRPDDRRVHLTASRAFSPPYTDVFVLGWDERDGRRADNEFYKLTDTLDERGIAYAAEW